MMKTSATGMIFRFSIVFFIAFQHMTRPEEFEYESRAVQVLFDRLTRPLPPKICLEARTKERKKPWSEDKIQAQLKRQEKAMADVDRHYPKEELEMLRKSRIRSLRNFGSGERLLHRREYLSGGLYRRDETDFSQVDISADLKNKIEEGEIAFHKTFVNIHGGDFSDLSTHSAYHNLKSANISRNQNFKHEQTELWQAYTIEPELAFPVMTLLAETNSLESCLKNKTKTSFHGAELDPAKLRRALSDSNFPFLLTVKDAIMNGRACHQIVLKSKSSFNASYARFVYYLDKKDPNKLLQAQFFKTPGGQPSYRSIRNQHNSVGFPMRWTTVENDTPDGPVTNVTEFVKVDLNPQWSEAEVFSSHYPTNYSVSDVTSGRGKLVQTPFPGVKEIPIEEAAFGQNYKRYFMVGFLFIVLPTVLIFQLRRDQGS